MFLFELGQTVVTPGALEVIKAHCVEITALIKRHATGDWSEMAKEDQNENKRAIKQGSRIFSSYKIGSDNAKIWIITEADRSATTILLPDEY